MTDVRVEVFPIAADRWIGVIEAPTGTFSTECRDPEQMPTVVARDAADVLGQANLRLELVDDLGNPWTPAGAAKQLGRMLAAGDASDRVGALRRQRRWCDVVGLVCLMIGGSGMMWWVVGAGQAWPSMVAAACLVIGSAAMLVRSRIIKRIWVLEPPTEPLHQRRWPDGT